LVVWTATAPDERKRVVTGWYKNATVFRREQKRDRSDTFYNVIASINDATLIPAEDRTFRVPRAQERRGFPGMSAAWYPDLFESREVQKYLGKLLAYVEGFGAVCQLPDLERTRPSSSRGTPRQPDIEKRQAIERSAMDQVELYYEGLGYRVEDVSAKRVGWDQEATNGDERLLIETKGLSGSDIRFELTCNEYDMSKTKRVSFRMCIVTNALDDPRLYVFSPDGKGWKCPDGTLDLEERVAAVGTMKRNEA
jgi:hypothetical protein